MAFETTIVYEVGPGPASVRAQTDSFLASADRFPSVELLLAIGCECEDPYYGRHTIVAPYAPLDPGETRACFSLVLEKMRHSGARGTSEWVSMLSGAMRDASGSAPRSEQSAYDLAALILLFIDCYSPEPIALKVGADVCRMLNAWIKPAVPWTNLPGTGTIVRAMFGAAWCDIRLNDIADDQRSLLVLPDGGFAGDVVWRERPPFLLGLCPAQDRAQGVPLPQGLGLGL